MTIKSKTEIMSRGIELDLTGPDDNAFVILRKAKDLAIMMGLDADVIMNEMMNGNYEHLVSSFEKYFGEYVTIYR